jgi:hypothetical protein
MSRVPCTGCEDVRLYLNPEDVCGLFLTSIALAIIQVIPRLTQLRHHGGASSRLRCLGAAHHQFASVGLGVLLADAANIKAPLVIENLFHEVWVI